MDAQLLLQVGIDLRLPGVIVCGLTLADLIPDQRGELLHAVVSSLVLKEIRRRGVFGRLAAAGCKQPQNHQNRQKHRSDSLHCVSS